MKKVSIIIPSYNQQDYLPYAIESALAQTEKCEVIVIDDGSTDNSLQVALSYPVELISQVNKGLASARNTGIMNATGDYIIPLDSDDILMENCAEKVAKLDTDIVMWDFKCFGTQNNEVRLGIPTLEDMKTANRLAYCSAIKREKLLEIGGYSPRMIWGYEDYALWFDLMRRGVTITHIPEILFMYRTKEQSMLTEAQKHHDELIAQIMKDNASVFA